MAANGKGGGNHEIVTSPPSEQDSITGAFFQVEMMAPDALIPYIHNPKAHPESQIKKIAGSLTEWSRDTEALLRTRREIGECIAALG